MNFIIKDRRNNDKGESTRNRERFIKRIEEQIKKNLPSIIEKKNIDDLSSSNKSIKIPIKGLNEPSFSYDFNTGDIDRILPGNKVFVRGDVIKRPSKNGGSGNGNGNGASKDGSGEDDFYISISKDEFLKYFFEDLELPELVKTSMNNIKMVKRERAGFKTSGSPSQLSVVKSFKTALSRNIAMSYIIEEELEKLKNELSKLDKKNILRKKEILIEIEKLEDLKKLPFFDNVDLRYHTDKLNFKPLTCAVMFCIMDISGSMGFKEKDIAKRFFTLLYMFLTKEYDKVDIIFIQHHEEAKEVSEEEFFNSRESGGTRVSPAIKLASEIIKDRYSISEWNAYACQISDGDTWGLEDANEAQTILHNDFLPYLQFMAYIEVCPDRSKKDDKSLLWQAYRKSAINNPYFDLRTIKKVSEIWPTFRKIFLKKELKEV